MEHVLERPQRTEDESVLDWRFDALESAGYSPIAALSLAVARHVDLHQALGLAAAGCPQDTALRILL
jgi:hypothetical protein